MNEYEAKIYEYFTQKDNFDMMVKVNEHADAVGAHLVRSFWDEVQFDLQQTLEEEERGVYSSHMSEDYNARYSKVWIQHPDWCSDGNAVVSVAFEDLHFGRQPYVGLNVNRGMKSHNTGKIWDEIRSLDELQNYRQDSNKYWAKWRWAPFSFKVLGELKGILPTHRSNIVVQAKEEAFELLNKVKDSLSKIIKDNKL